MLDPQELSYAQSHDVLLPVLDLVPDQTTEREEHLGTPDGILDLWPADAIGFVGRSFNVLVDDPYLSDVGYAEERKFISDYVKSSLNEINEWEAVYGVQPDANIKVREDPTESKLAPVRELYDPKLHPTLNKWFADALHATALYPLQRPEADTLADGTPITEDARPYFRHTMDAVGIRSRAAVMAAIMQDKFADREDGVEWLSVACGAAVPVLHAAKLLCDKEIELTLVDRDKNALNFAETLVAESGMSEKAKLIEMDVLSTFVRFGLLRAKNLSKELDKQFDAVDILGFLEYLPPRLASSLIKNAYDATKPGGIVVLGNMLDTHPQLDFHKKVVRWPGVRQRSTAELAKIIKDAGIPEDQVTAFLPTDGVYVVASIEKPNSTLKRLQNGKTLSIVGRTALVN